MPDFTLHHGDCLDVLRSLPEGSVDAVVTDPPYSSGGAFRSDRAAPTAAKYLGSYNSTTAGTFGEVVGDSRDALGWAMWATLWLSQCLRVSKAGAACVVFTDWRQLPNLSAVFQAAGWVWRGLAVWDKQGGCRPMSGRFAHQSEFAVWGTKGAIGWDYTKPSLPGVFRHSPVSAKARSHQTEKPVRLIEDMLPICLTDSVVLDPFAGSGTTGVACMNTGRNFIGVEIDAGYHAIAHRRISEAKAAADSLLIPA